MSYNTALASLCGQSARLSVLKERILSGEDVPELEEVLQIMEYSKNALLKEKEKLGYTDGLAFMEDNNFRGFSVKNGKLVGDTTYLLKICLPWYENAKNNYQYEVANYLIALYLENNPEVREELDAECEEKKRPRISVDALFLKLIHFVFPFFRKKRDA